MKYFLSALLFLYTFSVMAQATPGIDSGAAPADKSPQAAPAAAAPIAIDTPSASIAAAAITIDTQQGPLTVMIPQARLRDVQKDWQRYVGAGSKGKASSAQGQYTQYGAVNKNISPDPFNITATLLGTTDGVRVSVWLSDNNNFQNSKEPASDRKLALEKYMHDFAVAEYRQAVTEEKNIAISKEKDMEKTLSKLIREEERAAKRKDGDIASIQHATDAIATTKLDIQSQSAKIEAQKVNVQNNASDPNAAKGATKTLNELEAQKKSLERTNDKRGKDIDDWNNDIRAQDRAIADYKDKETTQKAVIEKQKQSIQDIQAKLDGIK